MLTYNGYPIPQRISSARIISSFTNPCDPILVESYTRRMFDTTPPPIMGYPSRIDWCDYGNEFMTGEEITEEHDGELVWYVTDGHHRTLAAIEAGMLDLDVEIDPSAFTIKAELEAYQQSTL